MELFRQHKTLSAAEKQIRICYISQIGRFSETESGFCINSIDQASVASICKSQGLLQVYIILQRHKILP